MSGFVLRPYQEAARDSALAYLRDESMTGRNGLVIAPTGSGKSLLIASIATALDGPCVVFQPSKEILEQNLGKLAHYGYRGSVFSASMGRKEIGAITLATIGSAISHAEVFRDVPYILIDECHLVSAKGGMYADFLESLAGTRVVGLTATPYRLASNSLGSELRFLTRTRPRIFRDVIHHTQIGDLFRDGYLCPLQYRRCDILPRERLKLNSTGADYTDASVQSLFGEVGFVGHLQAQVERELDAGRRNVLVFTRFVQESERLAKVVPGCAVVTAETPAAERAGILSDFKRGRIRVVSNVGIIATGFDYPELECVILARPSISLSLYYQQVGREIRPLYAPGGDLSTASGRHAAIAESAKPSAYVVDMVGLTQQFGKVEDLSLRNSSTKGEQWAVWSGERALTNVYFEQRADVDPKVVAKARRKRQFWAKRRREGGL